jgi:hypothetical protein
VISTRTILQAEKPEREPIMAKELERLVEKARTIEMTPEQLREQRQSFVYGNTHIENEIITRELVAEVDKNLTERKS